VAVEYSVYRDWRVYVTRFTDLVSNDEMLQVYTDIFGHADFKPGFFELCDLRNTLTMDINIGALQAVSDMTEKAHHDGAQMTRIAYLVNKEMNALICKLYGVVAESGNTETTGRFYNVREALAWLSIPDFPTEYI